MCTRWILTKYSGNAQYPPNHIDILTQPIKLILFWTKHCVIFFKFLILDFSVVLQREMQKAKKKRLNSIQNQGRDYFILQVFFLPSPMLLSSPLLILLSPHPFMNFTLWLAKSHSFPLFPVSSTGKLSPFPPSQQNRPFRLLVAPLVHPICLERFFYARTQLGPYRKKTISSSGSRVL